MARTLRTRWWPRFLLTGVLLVILGATLLSGAVAAYVGLSGAAIITVAIFRAASMKPEDYPPEAPHSARCARRPVLAMSAGRCVTAAACSRVALTTLAPVRVVLATARAGHVNVNRPGVARGGFATFRADSY